MQSGRLKSTISNQEQFAKIEKPEIRRSVFDRSHGYKTTLDPGILYPVFVDEALPGDTFDMKATMFGRLATPLKPIMDNIHFDLHFFSVPNRLLWDNWQKFMGEQIDPGDSINYLVPTVDFGGGGSVGEGTLADYFGLPIGVDCEPSALPFRAYNLIWNEWYRDQDIQDSRPVPKGDGPDLDSFVNILKYRNKSKDYFTSARPFAQKGDAVGIPLGGTAPVVSTDQQILLYNSNDSTNRSLYTYTATGDQGLDTVPSSPGYTHFGTQTGLETDLSNQTEATINAFRQAFQIQRMYEKDARGGTRYIEIIKSHFGISSPDARLQRPEFLGSGKAPINVMPVAQQSASESGNTPQGNLSGVGTLSLNNGGFVKSFTEHEIIIGLVSVKADLTYQNCMHKMWSRQTRNDFYWPSFANLGEQAILRKEIFAQGTSADEEVFGYAERYAEYRFKPSMVTGKFRSDATGSLDQWHLAQDFSTAPTLNPTFLEERRQYDRVVAVPSEPKFLLDCYFDLKCSRPMPTYSTPGLIDHF